MDSYHSETCGCKLCVKAHKEFLKQTREMLKEDRKQANSVKECAAWKKKAEQLFALFQDKQHVEYQGTMCSCKWCRCAKEARKIMGVK